MSFSLAVSHKENLSQSRCDSCLGVSRQAPTGEASVVTPARPFCQSDAFAPRDAPRPRPARRSHLSPAQPLSRQGAAAGRREAQSPRPRGGPSARGGVRPTVCVTRAPARTSHAWRRCAPGSIFSTAREYVSGVSFLLLLYTPTGAEFSSARPAGGAAPRLGPSDLRDRHPDALPGPLPGAPAPQRPGTEPGLSRSSALPAASRPWPLAGSAPAHCRLRGSPGAGRRFPRGQPGREQRPGSPWSGCGSRRSSR